MVVKVERKNGSVIAMLNGEIDHHSAKALREAIDNELKEMSGNWCWIFPEWALWTALGLGSSLAGIISSLP